MNGPQSIFFHLCSLDNTADCNYFMRARFTLLCLLILIPFLSKSQDFAWNDNCIKAYKESIKLNFFLAHQLMVEEKKKHPSNLLIPYIESQKDFLGTFISEDKNDLETLKKNNGLRIDEVNNYDGKSPYTRLCVAEYYMQIAIGRLKFEEYIGAVYEIRKAFKLLEENQKLYPDFKPNLSSLGFIHANIGSAPKNYQWMMNLLGFHGTIQQGLGELRQLYDATHRQPELAYLHDQTLILLTFLEMTLEKNKSSEAIRSRFYNITNLDQKPLLQFVKVAFHNANGENDSILAILSKRNQPPEAQRLNYLDYLDGNAHLNNLDYTAENYFKRYVSEFKGKSFVKSAYQRIAWIRLLRGDHGGYLSNIKKAGDEKNGSLFSDEDKQAAKEFIGNEPPNLLLLKSRLLFDGGYYQRSLAEIAGKPVSSFPSLRDKLEFTYRLARIFDKTNKQDKAIIYYDQTITNGKNLSYYFAANSALMMGLLYEQKGDALKAEEYFRICLSLRNHEYQNSLDQKAKAGLNRLGK